MFLQISFKWSIFYISIKQCQMHKIRALDITYLLTNFQPCGSLHWGQAFKMSHVCCCFAIVLVRYPVVFFHSFSTSAQELLLLWRIFKYCLMFCSTETSNLGCFIEFVASASVDLSKRPDLTRVRFWLKNLLNNFPDGCFWCGFL